MENVAKEKILGTILLFVGLSIIGYGINLGINIFIKAQDPPEVFKPISVETNSEIMPLANTNISMQKDLNEISPEEIQKMINGNLINPEMIKSIIPPEIFNNTSRMMNLTVFSLFIWILIVAGTKVSSLGISLIKTNSDIKF